MALPDDCWLPDGSDDGISLSEPLLTAGDVARLLGVPRSTVHAYARRDHDPLPSVAIGRHRRFHRSDVERWVTRQRH